MNSKFAENPYETWELITAASELILEAWELILEAWPLILEALEWTLEASALILKFWELILGAWEYVSFLTFLMCFQSSVLKLKSDLIRLFTCTKQLLAKNEKSTRIINTVNM